jgi:hypothetical protein
MTRHLLRVGPSLSTGVQETERDVGPAPGELERDRTPDATGGTRDEGDLSPQIRSLEERLRPRLADLVEQSLDLFLDALLTDDRCVGHGDTG